jgi:hypothetical protein
MRTGRLFIASLQARIRPLIVQWAQQSELVLLAPTPCYRLRGLDRTGRALPATDRENGGEDRVVAARVGPGLGTAEVVDGVARAAVPDAVFVGVALVYRIQADGTSVAGLVRDIAIENWEWALTVHF